MFGLILRPEYFYSDELSEQQYHTQGHYESFH